MRAQDDRPRSIEERLLDTPRRVAGVDSSGEPVRLGGHRLVAGRQSLGSFSGLRSWSISPGGMAIERKSRGRGVGRRLLHGAVPTDRQRGILQPLLLSRAEEGALRLVPAHRRLAAAVTMAIETPTGSDWRPSLDRLYWRHHEGERLTFQEVMSELARGDAAAAADRHAEAICTVARAPRPRPPTGREPKGPPARARRQPALRGDRRLLAARFLEAQPVRRP
jgi:GNAT superfamily N-acetyltransferase